MGSFFGGGTQTQKSTSSSEPWGPQVPYLTGAFNDASNAYNSSTAMGPYGGNYVAGPNGYQTAAESGAGNFANGVGATLPGAVANAGTPLMGAGSTAMGNATSLAANGISGPNAGLYGTLQGYGTGATRSPGVSPELSSSLEGAAVNGANSLNGFTNNLNTLGQTAASDPTARIASDASQYASNPGVQAAINATNAQIEQTLNEQTLPQLNTSAAAHGNVNSSRTGMEAGMAKEGAGIAEGNADASILNNAYNTGMGTASGLYSSGLNTGVNANTSGLFDVGLNTNNEANRELGQNEFNTTTQLGAANSGLGAGLNYATADANTRLGANNQLQGLAGLGFNSAAEAPSLAGANFNLLGGAGTMAQAGDQAGLTNAQDIYQGNYQFPWNNLDNYFNIVGKPQGQTTQGTSTTSNSGPGVAGGILGLGLGAAGLFGSGGAFPGALGSLGGLFGGGAGAASAAQLGAWNPLTNGGY